MYAIVRRITLPTEIDASGSRDLREFQAVHERQPGFIGALEVDEGDGRRLLVNLWESREAAEAGRRNVAPVAATKVVPQAAEPPEFIAAGPVSTPLEIRHAT